MPGKIQPWYLYAMNNPAIMIDRDGLDATGGAGALGLWQALSPLTGWGISHVDYSIPWGLPNVINVITRAASLIFQYTPFLSFPSGGGGGGMFGGAGMFGAGGVIQAVFNWALGGGLPGTMGSPGACYAQEAGCKCKSIAIKAPKGGEGIRGLPLGPYGDADHLGYGFNARIEGDVTGDSTVWGRRKQDCSIRQYISKLERIYDKDGKNILNYFYDDKHGPGTSKIDDKTAGGLDQGWDTLMRGYRQEPDIGTDAYTWKLHNSSWYEYTDMPGWPPVTGQPKIPAAAAAIVVQRLDIKVVCTGSDGKTIVARFEVKQTYASDGRTWTPTDTVGPNPALPKTWTP